MDNNLQNLYNSLSNQVDIGTFESFSSKMKTKEERKAFYNSIRQAGFDLGDYGKYENRLKKKKTLRNWKVVLEKLLKHLQIF